MTSRRFTLDGKPYQPTPDEAPPPPDDVYAAEDAFRPRPPPADDELEGEEGQP